MPSKHPDLTFEAISRGDSHSCNSVTSESRFAEASNGSVLGPSSNHTKCDVLSYSHIPTEIGRF